MKPIMIHTYQVSGMTCSSCETKVKNALLHIPTVRSVSVSKEQGTVVISMEKHLPIGDLQAALDSVGKYRISATENTGTDNRQKSWLQTYKPILLIFLYISGVTLLIQWASAERSIMVWMQHFMAAFFLVFSFFKFLNLRGFAESYRMYDVLARKFPLWAYVYAFVELSLGIAYTINYQPWITNTITVVIMGISIIGVLQTVLNKKNIQCACLGAIFELPMSTVTIIEDGLMIGMGIAMLFLM